MPSALERERALGGANQADFFQQALEASRAVREAEKQAKNIVRADEMPWEDSPHGRIKHVLNGYMDTREHCLDIFQLFLEEGGRSGKHRHLSEELLYVVEGSGYDLHWDVDFDCADEYIWKWKDKPARHEWREGQFVYIPPYSIHQHVNAQADRPARLISITSRIVKAMGFDWIDQLEESSRSK